MPYVYDPNLDKDKNEEEGLPSGSSAQISAGSSSAEAPIASGSSSSTQTQPKELKTGSGYQNLDKYLTTNDAQSFGKQVTGKVGDKIDTAKQNQSSASTDFTNQVQSANDTPDTDKLNQTLANPTAADPTKFQKWMSQSYDGPKSLGESQDAWNKYWSGTNQAQDESKALGTEAGRFSLLDSYFGRPQYNFGQKSLDNLLIQKSGTGREAQSLQNQASQLKSQGDQNAKNLQGVAAQRAGQVEQSRGQVNDAFNQAQTQAQDSITNTTNQANAQRDETIKAIKEGLANGTLTNDQFSKLGLDDTQKNMTLYGLNPSDYITKNNVGINQAATDEQRARINALSQLSGSDQTFLGSKEDMSPDLSFDKNRFLQDQQSTAAGYISDMGNAINTVKGIAPLSGEYIRSLNSQSDIGDLISQLNKSRSEWEAQKAQGNPYGDVRLDQINQAMNALNPVLKKYAVNQTTGAANYLKVQ